MKKEFFKLSGILCLITLVASLLLAFVNNITEDKITEAAEIASENSMKNIIPEAQEFKELSENVYEGIKNDKILGYIVKITEAGFGGDIEMMVGFDENDTVLGIDILSNSETPGLGAKVTTESFKSQFINKPSKLTVTKTPVEDDSEIQAITGATITSKATVKGIENAREILEKVKGDLK